RVGRAAPEARVRAVLEPFDLSDGGKLADAVRAIFLVFAQVAIAFVPAAGLLDAIVGASRKREPGTEAIRERPATAGGPRMGLVGIEAIGWTDHGAGLVHVLARAIAVDEPELLVE